MDKLKEFVLNKLTLRVSYIVAAFSASHLVSLASSPFVQAELLKAGVTFTVNNPERLRIYLVGLMLVGGEFVFNLFHKKVILPQVSNQGETK